MAARERGFLGTSLDRRHAEVGGLARTSDRPAARTGHGATADER